MWRHCDFDPKSHFWNAKGLDGQYSKGMSDYSCVRTCSSRPEAEVLKSVLEAHGIPCIVQADDAGGMRPYLNVGFGVGIRIRTQDLARAEEILRTYENDSTEPVE